MGWPTHAAAAGNSNVSVDISGKFAFFLDALIGHFCYASSP